jgi:metallo-beta-lactamase superfamily protein
VWRSAATASTPVIDGEGRLRPDEALPGVPAACWVRHRALLDDGGLLPIVIGGSLLRGHGQTVLVDLGYGPGALGDTPTGRLPGSLRALGVEPVNVTDVLLTHLHRDHVGWAASGGVAVFPHARLCYALLSIPRLGARESKADRPDNGRDNLDAPMDGPGQVHGSYSGRVLGHSAVTELLKHVPRPGELVTGALATMRRRRSGDASTAGEEGGTKPSPG